MKISMMNTCKFAAGKSGAVCGADTSIILFAEPFQQGRQNLKNTTTSMRELFIINSKSRLVMIKYFMLSKTHTSTFCI